jgi:hypothetical protein
MVSMYFNACKNFLKFYWVFKVQKQPTLNIYQLIFYWVPDSTPAALQFILSARQ